MTERLVPHAALAVLVCVGALLAACVHAGAVDTTPHAEAVAAPDGVRIAYRTSGDGTPALVFVHGWGGDGTIWRDVIDELAAEHRCIAIDLPGHGDSGSERTDWTLASYAADVAEVVRAEDLREVVLVGHSMGGTVCLAAAAQLRGRVVAVVGVDSLRDAEYRPPQDAVAFFARFSSDFDGTLDAWARSAIAPSSSADVAAEVVRRARAADRRALLGILPELLTADLRALFSAAGVPIRCIASSQGRSTSVPVQVETNRRYADFDAVVLDDVGHFAMLERPAEFTEALRSVVHALAGGSVAGRRGR